MTMVNLSWTEHACIVILFIIIAGLAYAGII